MRNCILHERTQWYEDSILYQRLSHGLIGFTLHDRCPPFRHHCFWAITFVIVYQSWILIQRSLAQNKGWDWIGGFQGHLWPKKDVKSILFVCFIVKCSSQWFIDGPINFFLTILFRMWSKREIRKYRNNWGFVFTLRPSLFSSLKPPNICKANLAGMFLGSHLQQLCFFLFQLDTQDDHQSQ